MTTGAAGHLPAGVPRRDAGYELAELSPCGQARPDAEFAPLRAIAARRATAVLSP